MELLVTHEIDRKRDGSRIVRNFFFNSKPETNLATTMATFKKSEKKEAKLNYNISLKSTIHQDRRKALVEHLVKLEFPNWEIKIGFLRDNK